MRWSGSARAMAALLWLMLVAAPAAAQQALVVVNSGLVYLPQSGVALNAATGKVQWRTPRYSGQVLSNRRGLLIVSYLAVIHREQDSSFSWRWTRYCRLRAANGRPRWCADALDALGAKLSASGKLLYIQQPEHVDLYDARSGRHLHSLGSTPDGEMVALPGNGVAVYTAQPRRSRLWAFSLAMQRVVVKQFARIIFAFHGPGAGVLWYAPQAGRFINPLGAAAPAPTPAADPGSFPDAVTNRWGFAISQSRGRQQRISGGRYEGAVWSHAMKGDPTLRLFGRSVIVWQREQKGTLLTLFGLAHGRLRFRRALPVRVVAAMMDRGPTTEPPGLALFAPRDLLWLDGASGQVRWWQHADSYEPAALTGPAVLAWDGGRLVAFSRATGDVLWRVRFQLRGKSQH